MRETVTDLLEVIGLVFLAVAAGIAALRWGWPAAAATLGVALLLVSALIELRGPSRRRRPDADV